MGNKHIPEHGQHYRHSTKARLAETARHVGKLSDGDGAAQQLHQFRLCCAGLVVAQSYKTRTGSGLKGTGTGADPDEVQQKSQEILNDLKVTLESLPHPFFLSSAHTQLSQSPHTLQHFGDGLDPYEVQQKSRETLNDLKVTPTHPWAPDVPLLSLSPPRQLPE